MRLSYATRAEAQAVADRIFNDMQGDLEPGTIRWAIPCRDVDLDGNPSDTWWHVAIDERVVGVLTEEEIASVPELAERMEGFP